MPSVLRPVLRPAVWGLLTALHVAPAAASAARGTEIETLPPPRPADAEALAGALVEVETRAPSPSTSDYLQDLLTALLHWLADALPGFDPEWLRAEVVLWGLRILLISMALAIGLLAARRWLTRKRPAPTPTRPLGRPTDSDDGTDGADGDRGAKVRDLLAAGEASAALEALWWWLAKALGAAEAESSWTTRELVTRAGRRELMPAVRSFDRLLYATEDPTVGDVETLWSRLRHDLEDRA